LVVGAPREQLAENRLPVAAGKDNGTRMLLYAVRQAPGWTALMVLAAVMGDASALLLPAAVARAVDAAVAGAPQGQDVVWVGSLIGLGMAGEVLSMWSAAASGAMVALALRRSLVGRVLRAGLPGQRHFTPGDLTSRMVTGASQASGLVQAMLSVADSALLAAGGVAGLALIDWPLAVAFIVSVPVAVVAMRRFVTQISQLMTRYQELQGRLSALLVESLAGSRTIAASGTTAREAQRVLEPLPALAEVGWATWEAQRRAVWKLSLLSPLAELTVLGVAGAAVSAGRISPGQWIAAAGYVTIALGLTGVVDTLLQVASIRAGTTRLAEVLSLPAGPGGCLPVPPGPGRISFRSVRVRLGDEIVLDAVDLDIPPGKLVAVVGRSGAGKSTLAALAGGLLAPDEGQVLLDGAELASLHPGQLRRAVAYAFERPALLGETVHDMIACGPGPVSRAQVETAAALASADGFIRRLPRSYDTALAEAPLSGGERQRLGLARAVTGDPAVLILDDATSSLDTATEAEVTSTLTRLLAGRTRIVVAHRAGTAARADLVVWLENARVRAVAPHDNLCREPAYRTMFGAAQEAM
jgi:ATP-binding cassette, subfamily B, bacterial